MEQPQGRIRTGIRSWTREGFSLAAIATLTWLASSGGNANAADDFAAAATRRFQLAEERYQKEPQITEAAWRFGRACFDIADFATNGTQRARFANLGIAACEKALARDSNSAPAHYYLGMNLAQLAQTKLLGALRIVSRMRNEFAAALALDEHFDCAGPDRNLGLLYRDAPSLGSIGDQTKAREHLEHAVELAPQHPGNRLNLIESDLKWGRGEAARHQLTALEAVWPSARTNYAGEDWASSWPDWERRFKQAQKRIDGRVKLDDSKH